MKAEVIVLVALGSLVTAPCAMSMTSPEETTQAMHSTTQLNRLATQSSAYLRQHAGNPVAWYPWGLEAFDKARREDKPIFLSIGYSACHWCHVMAHESFENKAIAALLNRHFVAIKVDREELPDIDEIYMNAVQLMTGSGGWPLSVFMTADLQPFFGGTYFPPTDQYGRPGFERILLQIADIWRTRRGDIEQSAAALTKALESRVLSATGTAVPTPQVLAGAVDELMSRLDRQDGGFGSAPKFPAAGAISLLLRRYRQTGDKNILRSATLTLDRMASGGMYDQLGGGFHRYSVDAQWLVPHFEKMLYDNALLSKVYVEAYQVTGNQAYLKVARDTLAYVAQNMTDPQGGFYASEDADSEGHEGRYYVWSQQDFRAALAPPDAKLAEQYFGVTATGNFEGRNILTSRNGPPADPARLNRIVKALQEARTRRVRPGRDEKIIAAWNGLMISSFAQAYQVTGDPALLESALKAARFMDATLYADNTLLHSYCAGTTGGPAYLDDYAMLGSAYLDLYESTFDYAWVLAAEQAALQMMNLFRPAEGGPFFFTSEQHSHLLVRTRSCVDGSIPSGNSMATLLLLRLARLGDRPHYTQTAAEIVGGVGALLTTQPAAFTYLVAAADFLTGPTQEIAVIGEAGSVGTVRMLAAVRGGFAPNKVVGFLDPRAPDTPSLLRDLPFLRQREMVDGKTTAYICENFICKKPMTDATEVARFMHSTAWNADKE